MGPTGVLVLATAILALAEDVPEESAGGRLHGIVTTTTGATFHGYLRWDEGQGGAAGWSWADLLAGSKELPPGNRRDAERLGMLPGRGSLEFRGVRIAWDGDGEEGPDSTWSGIRFGHLRRLTVAGERTALLELKSGRTVELTLSASRPGSPRGVEVTPPRGEPVRVPWKMPGPRHLNGNRTL